MLYDTPTSQKQNDQIPSHKARILDPNSPAAKRLATEGDHRAHCVQALLHRKTNIGALIIRAGFRGPLYSYNQEPAKMV